MNITITDLALKKAIEKIEKTSAKFLRIGIKGGSCSGYSNILELDYNDLNPKKDVIFTFGNEKQLNIIIDKKSLKLLEGMTLDYEQNLMKSGFKIINPNAISECGCGKSFSIKR